MGRFAAHLRFFNGIESSPMKINSLPLNLQAVQKRMGQNIHHYVNSVPQELRGRVTRQHVIDLERKTKFITNRIIKNMFSSVEALMGVASKRVGAEDPMRTVHLASRDGQMVTMDHCLPYMINPPEDVIGLRFTASKVGERIKTDLSEDAKKLQAFVKLYRHPSSDSGGQVHPRSEHRDHPVGRRHHLGHA